MRGDKEDIIHVPNPSTRRPAHSEVPETLLRTGREQGALSSARGAGIGLLEADPTPSLGAVLPRRACIVIRATATMR